MSKIGHVRASLVASIQQGVRANDSDFADELRKTGHAASETPSHYTSVDSREPEVHLHRLVPEGKPADPCSSTTDRGAPHAAPAATPLVGQYNEPTMDRVASKSVAFEAPATGSEMGPTAGIPAELGGRPVPQPNATVQPTGVTETLAGSRVFGIHLFAGRYLSELYASASCGLPPLPSRAGIADTEGTAVAPHAGVRETAGLMVSTMTPYPPQYGAMQVWGDMARTAVGAPREEAEPAAVAAISDTPRAVPWPEDSLRLTKNANGGLTLWLRDYRMDDTAATPVVEAMVQEARSKGLKLEKVLWNGREVWTSLNES
ncbi:hypothetical protein ACVCL4_15905 [Rhodanobacter sp. UC4444_H11]